MVTFTEELFNGKLHFLYNVSFYEVMKLQSFQFEVCDVIPASVENILPLLFFFVVDFMKKEPKTKFYGVFEHFSQTHEITKF